ncbi:DEAD/DEAH box helicase [Pseudoduganella sp. RAF53_2]|uniref:DEAD/DEAH box helicase n=1 Tax=unclassified Pseudoduganella TaxID=2637179 RepID=UPI003F961186
MSFASLKLIDALLGTLESLGYATPTPVQKQAIPAVLAGRDLMAAAQTGTGKTAAFALPLLQRLTMEGAASPGAARSLVLVPTRELAEQVHESFRAYGRNVPLRFAVAYGGVPIEPQITKLRKGVDVLVATPGRLLDLLRQGALSLAQLQTLVLDEADRMLDLGFAHDLDAVFAALPARRQTLLFSATFSDAIRAMAKQLLSDPLSVQASAPNTAARTVRQLVYTTDKKAKPELFLHLLQKLGWSHLLVFVKTRKGVEALVSLLKAAGIAADSIHGDKPQPARLKALERLKAREVQVLVATDVAARGLDIEALPLVVNFDLPTVAEDYVHRIGRTGRAGAEGEAISLVCADEVELLRAVETLTKQVFQRLEEPGFEADHRVPSTGAPTQAASKPDARAGKPTPSGTPAGPASQSRRGSSAERGAGPSTKGGPAGRVTGSKGGTPAPDARGGRGASGAVDSEAHRAGRTGGKSPPDARGGRGATAPVGRSEAAEAPRPAGGYGSLGTYDEPEPKRRGTPRGEGRQQPGNEGRSAATRSAGRNAGGARSAGGGDARGAGGARGTGGGDARGAGKGNVIVVAGRGAKSAAKAAGKAVRQGGGKTGGRGSKR